ncbi:Crp/Fnr family transcriptional regulator [Synechococcus sp. CS-602]|uniref:cyclic nucleotide-binding domain-containing protein n=1 Tax=Synechococcaceae TaxID=1890426 RepID=UPI0008FF25B2|nr:MULTISPECIES: Crp/Fnr family transcriptional regulator [Synechococcaceae]MCT4364648.1 Crp/Fnr family transcriptional regulator [Candidatus Regnicoccus frigidus MAG-AL1]APD47771.1 cyclic nucleotide-binding protein [Synechococcus sp. SynAce01]MCT0202837.1 Crp/Fnr family transcriptional regulator [Synechococcus sp. CS-603]MCT0204827.1 Crp/Fnr family transcriptional regulator [Synechococcus sp. CS-602]MCT0245063.1 Crp/Fnr family transcriptional regulator [Synechococcus sp. CS-601]
MACQLDGETFTLPTGTRIFGHGEPANAIYAVRKGIVEIIDQAGDRLCYRPGELFSYLDIVWRGGYFRHEAIARTPVELVKLGRLSFLNLLHNHPTLAIDLIGQQHERLREQRASGSYCY